MKIVKPSVEIWKQGYELDDIWKHIERCARVCYQTTKKNKGESSYDWIRRVIVKDGKPNIAQHFSVLEHGTVYLFMTSVIKASKYFSNPYSIAEIDERGYCFITTNMRVIVENKWDDDLYYLCEPTEGHALRTTFSIVTNIGVSRELNRHRSHSISEESTRYCNYSKNRFGKQLTFTEPIIDDPFNYNIMKDAMGSAEESYMKLIEHGISPQIARDILPLSTKTQVIHTAFNVHWKDFVALRADGVSGKPHPEAKIIADKIKQLLGKSINQ